MKSPEDIANTGWCGPREHKTRAATLRRLAGGLRQHVEGGPLGLSEAEKKTLAQAAELLNVMANRSSKAAALAQKSMDERAAREKAIRAVIGSSPFNALASVADRVALIAAAKGKWFANEYIHDLERLDHEFQDVLNESIPYQLSGIASGKTAHAVLEEAWTKFQAGRNDLVAKLRGVIDRIERIGANIPKESS